MLLQKKIVADPNDVRERLAELGLDPETLQEAVSQGYVASGTCTPNDPPNMHGMMFWARTVRALRELLSDREWKRLEFGGLSLAVSGDRAVAVVVWTGDGGTGDAAREPSTKYARGPASVAAVESNAQQMDQMDWFSAFARHDNDDDVEAEPEALEEPWPDPGTLPPWTMWVLLIRIAADELRCELSLPDTIGPDGRPDGWAQRILLPPIPRQGTPIRIERDDGPDIDVDVSRK